MLCDKVSTKSKRKSYQLLWGLQWCIGPSVYEKRWNENLCCGNTIVWMCMVRLGFIGLEINIYYVREVV